MDKWLCYNRILKKERLAFAIPRLTRRAYNWWLQEEDDRKFYKEPAITTLENLKLLLRSKYASKGHTSLKSPMKEATSSETVTCYGKEKTVSKPSMDDQRFCFSKEEKEELLQVIKNVKKQLRKTSATNPSLETQNQEPFKAVYVLIIYNHFMDLH
ncbi:hypothetical protein Bca52824_087279 [Brassica carinata]|uniref:Uncharacterized protein n=1 Tax=Brassica carinata TaxID=52824 RepID=A0A8X7TNG6_BRACI|nr:hypothetical protein Bca52824_087279 [Brassica carinata]